MPNLMPQRCQASLEAVIQVALAHHNPFLVWVIKPQQVFLAAVSQPPGPQHTSANQALGYVFNHLAFTKA